MWWLDPATRTFTQETRLFGAYGTSSGNLYGGAYDDVNDEIYTVYTQDGRLEGVTDIPQLSNQDPVRSTVDALCAATRPGTLCGDESSCGDGICSGDETLDGCALDCDAPVCSDGVCGPGEDFTCVPDCGERDRVAECGSGGDGGVDAGIVDAAVVDADVPDASMVDAATVDAATVDAATVDAGMVGELDGARDADGGPPRIDGPSGCSCRVRRSRSPALPTATTILVMLATARAAVRRRRREPTGAARSIYRASRTSA